MQPGPGACLLGAREWGHLAFPCPSPLSIPRASFFSGTNSSESRKTKKKKSHLSLVGTASSLGSNKKKKPKPPAPPTPSIYDDIN